MENSLLRDIPSAESLVSGGLPKKKIIREYYIDWMRFTSVHLVVLTHSIINAMDATDIYGDEAMKNIPYNEELVEKASGFIKTLL